MEHSDGSEALAVSKPEGIYQRREVGAGMSHVPWHEALSEPCWCGEKHHPVDASHLNACSRQHLGRVVQLRPSQKTASEATHE